MNETANIYGAEAEFTAQIIGLNHVCFLIDDVILEYNVFNDVVGIYRHKLTEELNYKYKTEKFNSGICCSNYNLIFNNYHDFVHDCLETVGHPDIKKFVTYKDKARIFKIIREINTKNQNINNILKRWFNEIMDNIENCFGPTITNVSNEEKDEYSCFSLIDQSLLGTNDSTLSTNNLNGRCGPNYGRCPSGQCCGKNGKCGTKAN